MQFQTIINGLMGGILCIRKAMWADEIPSITRLQLKLTTRV